MGKIIVALRSTPSKYDCDFSEMEYKMFALKKRSFEGGFWPLKSDLEKYF